MSDIYLTDKELAELIKKNVQSLRNDRYLGRGIPYLKNGRNVLYRLSDVESFLHSRRVSTKDAK